jgi:hypothetical protein
MMKTNSLTLHSHFTYGDNKPWKLEIPIGVRCVLTHLSYFRHYNRPQDCLTRRFAVLTSI